MMTEQEFSRWQAVTADSRYRWVADHITGMNGKGELFYTGGEAGVYMRLYPDGRLSLGTYEDAYPHAGLRADERLTRILQEHGYADVTIQKSALKDWNDDLKVQCQQKEELQMGEMV